VVYESAKVMKFDVLQSSAQTVTLRPEARPLVKWAGGKNQLLPRLLPQVPSQYNRYIEPFFGGGALFFKLQPDQAIIADRNPELINLYQTVAYNVTAIIDLLTIYRNHSNIKQLYYELREQNWLELTAVEAAARTIFLNKTCFNGLYRVNRHGKFNVSFGKHKSLRIFDAAGLQAAAQLLRRAVIVCADYKTILRDYAAPGDFIFLDPPYLPITRYSRFNNYTKEQFYLHDHRELAKEVVRLHRLGCHILLTNSNHPTVHELYHWFDIQIASSRRAINCRAQKRTGQDLIINIPPTPQRVLSQLPTPIPANLLQWST
jgi:DNA adenine methylase